jgi:sugar/nucleoside kinase (ribokinase family)
MPGKDDTAAVLCIGRIYCDLIFTGLSNLPTLGRELFADGMEIAAGGGAFIAAAHMANVGRRAALVARLGTDSLSKETERQIRSMDIDLQFVEKADDAGPQVTVAAVVKDERAFLTRRAGPAQPSTLSSALKWGPARHLHIAEYATLAEIPDLAIRAKQNGLTVSLDPSWDETLIYQPDLLSACTGVDIFLPNLEEAYAITGERDPTEALEKLAEAFPVVALKGGAAGAWMLSGDQLIHKPAQSVVVVDTTGAGDAFNAGFINAWLNGEPNTSCVEAGIRAGTLAVQVAGGAGVLL